MLLYLLRKSYALIYHLIIASEPVSEALLPIYNQLMTLRRCLFEVKRSGGVSSPRELYPYNMKVLLYQCVSFQLSSAEPITSRFVPSCLLPSRWLESECVANLRLQLNSIDQMRVDGKFMIGSDVPDGQGRVTELLDECIHMAYDLRVDAEDQRHEDEHRRGRGRGDWHEHEVESEGEAENEYGQDDGVLQVGVTA